MLLPDPAPFDHDVVVRPRSRQPVIPWFFRNRKTGEITVAQRPNLALGVFLAATVARWLLGGGGPISRGLSLIAGGAVIWWAADEVVRGVNPWRRVLGAAVLTALAVNQFL
jgi:hypothetical protein